MKKVTNFDEGALNQETAFYFQKQKEKEDDFMNYAVQMASLSRSDDKKEKFMGKEVPQPKIGAVLVTSKYIYCAARSGLKYGDHAEYTILQDYFSNKKVEDGAALYTTLEPCTPESRSKWSESCASLIINKNIKKVCVGTLDANPLVFGTGINMLLEKGINVTFFKDEYVQELKKLNEEFFNFCKEYPDYKILKRVDHFLKNKIDEDALKVYYNLTKIHSDIYIKFYRDMIDSEQIKEGKIDGTLTISKEMALAFAKKPSYFLAGYNAGIINNLNKEMLEDDFREKRIYIDKSLLTLCNINYENNIFEEIMAMIDPSIVAYKQQNYTDMTKKISQQFANKINLREYIINAIVHNNYNDNIGITVEIEDNKTIKVINILSIELEKYDLEQIKQQFENGELHSIPTNPILMNYFVTSKLAENTGLGTRNRNKNFVKFDVQKQNEKTILITTLTLK